MLQRVGISMTDQELRHLSLLQKRFGVRSRSEFVRELMKRYEKLESDLSALNRCLHGYLERPESGPRESSALLKAAAKNQAFEDWTG